MGDPHVNPSLVAGFGVAALAELVAPFLLALFLARRFGARWRFWWIGVLVFLVFQGVTRIPVMVYLQTRPWLIEATKEPAGFWLFLAAAALTAGLFEEGGRWLAFRYAVSPEERTWRTALMMGAGHGGLESFGIGVLGALGLMGYLAVMLMPPEAMGRAGEKVAEARRQFAALQGWEPLAGAFERLGAMACHLTFSVLVLQSFRRGARWWWCALGAHALLDFTAPGLLHAGSEWWGAGPALLATEGLVGLYAVVGLWVIAALKPGAEAPSIWEARPVGPSDPLTSPPTGADAPGNGEPGASLF